MKFVFNLSKEVLTDSEIKVHERFRTCSYLAQD